jgi:hypothetical protein
MQWSKQIESSFDVRSEMVPQLKRELAVCSCKEAYKMCFAGFGWPFGRIYPVIVRLDTEALAMLNSEIFFDDPACLIVHNI